MKKIILYALLFVSPVITEAQQKNAKQVVQDPAALLEKGRQAFLNYDFDAAESAYSQYRDLMQRRKQPVDEEFEIDESNLEIAQNALERVENIVVIDSLSLPGDAFFKSYRLSESSGKLVDGKTLLNNPGVPSDQVAFQNENRDYLIWSQPNSDNILVLKESNLLLNGEWETHDVIIGEDEGADLAYPFLTADGQTLYFASDREGSMGGYDIFVAQRDPLSGEFRQPLNIGMPYNSPYDDFMLAVDEENRIGWWATNRNSDDGNVTVYVYLINDVRQNYPSDHEDIISLARLDNFRLTHPEGQQQKIETLLNTLPKPGNKSQSKKEDFQFPIEDGKIYTQLSDFRSKEASDKMKQLIKKEKDLESAGVQLERLRLQYNSRNQSLIPKIQELEKEIELLQEEVRKTRSEVYRLEKAKR